MKKFLITAVTLLISLGVMAQATNDRTLRLYYGGEVIFSRALSLLDSLNFKINKVEEDDDKPISPDLSKCDVNYSESGLYLGIIGFNTELNEKSIGLLTTQTVNSYKKFVNDFSVNKATVLYYAEENALNRLTSASFPSDLMSASIVTFTDGLDKGSLAFNEYYENMGSVQYLADLNKRILSDKVCGSNIKIDAYAIGLRGNDVQDIESFKNNLKNLSSSEDKMFEANDMSEVNETFSDIARSLYSSTSVFSMTFVIPVLDNGNVIRFTFDDVKETEGEKSKCYIEATYKNRNLTDLKFEGCIYKGGDIIYGVMQSDRRLAFKFEGLYDLNNNELPYDNIQNFDYTPNGEYTWQINSEFDGDDDVKAEITKKSAVVMLVLDCSTSLGDDFANMQSAANNFISLLLNAKEQNNTVSFDANGGTGSMSSMTFGKGETKSLIANSFTRTGYAFTGWNTKADGTGTSYSDKQSITPTDNLTLYAQWEETVEYITISFIANGGSGSMQSVSVAKGSSTTLPDVTFTRSGYNFKGWNTKADGSGFAYQNKQSIASYNNLTLFAQWENPFTGMANGHVWVDLGLPSGTKWATTNVGATTPEGYGNYYAWGETSPKSSYTSSNYTYTGTPTTLPLSNDVANVMWGGDWRMPTKAEQDELRTECTWIWTTQNGVNGYKVTSKVNSNSIFLPAVGGCWDFTVNSVGSFGSYWSSSLDSNDSDNAYSVSFDSYGKDWGFVRPRCYGQSVRPVLR